MQDRKTGLLTTKEAAHFLGLSPQTLEKWRYLGKGPAYTRLGAKLIRYRLPDLIGFLEGGQSE